MRSSSDLAPATREFERLWRIVARRAGAFSAFFIAISLATQLVVILSADGIAPGCQTVLGGDFVAFWTAAHALVEGRATQMYELSAFEDALTQATGCERLFMMWQYPPTMFLALYPIGMLGYFAAYAVWMLAGIAVFVAAMRYAEFSWRTIAIAVCAPTTAIVVFAGQVSFLTSALLIIAAFFARSRPIVAGVAAGLLTIKPQLGVLIPIAFVAAGCWRAFFAAAIVSMGLAAAALAAFGVEGWTAFIDGVSRIYTDYTEDGEATPARHMTTLMSQLRLLGVDQAAASWAHYGFSAVIGAIVAVVWRRRGDERLAGAMLCAAAVMVTPYAYRYELMAMAAPACVLAMEGARTQWFRFERPALLAGWVAIAVYEQAPFADVVQYPFWVSFACFALLVRRALRCSACASAQSASDDAPNMPGFQLTRATMR